MGSDGGKRSGTVRLDGVTTPAPETARERAAPKGFAWSLDDLAALDAATAAALAGFKRDRLSLDRLTSLDAATATATAGFEDGRLSLAGLVALDRGRIYSRLSSRSRILRSSAT